MAWLTDFPLLFIQLPAAITNDRTQLPFDDRRDMGRMALSCATQSSLCCQERGEPPRRKLTKAVNLPLSPLDKLL